MYYRQILTICIISIIIGTCFVSADQIDGPEPVYSEDEDYSIWVEESERPTPPPGVIFILDNSGSISLSEWNGMKHAIEDSFYIQGGFCDARGLRIGVVTFTDYAIFSIAPRIICDDYTTEDFLEDVDSMPTPSGSSTEICTGVIKATDLASHMIVMTDALPGDPDCAIDACEAARLGGQKVSMAYYPNTGGGFPFTECTNSDGQYPDQPIGYESYVSTSVEMRDTISSWFQNDFQSYFVFYQ